MSQLVKRLGIVVIVNGPAAVLLSGHKLSVYLQKLQPRCKAVFQYPVGYGRLPTHCLSLNSRQAFAQWLQRPHQYLYCRLTGITPRQKVLVSVQQCLSIGKKIPHGKMRGPLTECPALSVSVRCPLLSSVAVRPCSSRGRSFSLALTGLAKTPEGGCPGRERSLSRTLRALSGFSDTQASSSAARDACGCTVWSVMPWSERPCWI